MNTLAQFLDLDSLKAVSLSPTQRALTVSGMPDPGSSHVFDENGASYSIILNLLGIKQEDIGIRVNEQKREIAVLAKKEMQNSKRGFFWVFGVPPEGLLSSVSTRYRGGVLEIVIPKMQRSAEVISA